jgi:hypothetical protein
MKLIFGGLISVVLLGIYVHLVRVAVKVVYCVDAAGCVRSTGGAFNVGMAQALSVISGLVSALVIAELALAKPGKAPVLRVLTENASPLAVRTVAIVSTFYVLVWIGVGLTAFMVGLYHPEKVPAITTLGQAWLGLAVSSAYSYFGLNPENREQH